jgi:hypothetical protein
MTNQEAIIDKQNAELTKIIELLSDLQIKNVVSIDDEWNGNDKLSIYNKTSIESFCSTFQIDLTEDEEVELSNSGDIQTIEQLLLTEINELEELKDRVRGVFLNLTLDPTLESLNSLLESIASQVNVYRYSNIAQQIFQELQGRTLFIIDRNMEKVHGSKDALVEFLLSINKDRAIENLDLIIVYSGEDNRDYVSFDTKVRYIDDKLRAISPISSDDIEEIAGLMSYQLWAIDKTHSEEILKEKLLDTITQSFLGHSIYYYLRNHLEVHKKVARKIIYQANQNMQDLSLSALIEGEHFVESFNRARDCLLSNDFSNNQISHAITKNIIKAEKRASLKLVNEEGSWQNKKKARLASIKDNGHYLSVAKHGVVDYMVNNLYKDIATGDIFEFEFITSDFALDTALGLIITPECDCIIRGYPPKRKVKEFRVLLLEKKLLSSLTPKQLADVSITLWPFYINSDYYLLERTKNIITIDARVLDLCTLNKRGDAIFDYGDINEALEFKTHHSNDFLKKELPLWKSQLQQYVSKREELMMGALEEAAAENDGVTSRISESFMHETITDFYKIVFKKITDKDGFNIRRVGRLEPRRTLELIQEITNHSGRTGSEPLAALW